VAAALQQRNVMMFARSALLACLCLAVASPAAPQGRSGGGMRGGFGRGPSPPPVTSMNLPNWGNSPPAISPFRGPATGAPNPFPLRPGVDAFRATAKTYSPRFSPGFRDIDGRWNGYRNVTGEKWRRHDGYGRRHDGYGKGFYPGAVYIGGSPYYYPGYPGVIDPAYPPEPLPSAEPEGFLRLLITPRNANVFIDGVHEGTVDDFGGTGERTLRAGLHTVHVEADGFEPVEFDVRVPVNDTITLRRDLEPRRVLPPYVPPPAPAPSAAPKTIYVIPRCYLGDSQPRQEQLPAGCSLANLRTLN
jgi:hypothetical protein